MALVNIHPPLLFSSDKMVKEKQINGKNLFMCEECELLYLKKELAQECQDYCKKNGTPNLYIIENALPDDAI